jgi:hypothetical protein
MPPFTIGHKLSGNPKSGYATAARRNLNKLFSRSVAKHLSEPDPEDKGKRLRVDRMVLHLYKLVMKKDDVKAARVLIERLEGACPQTVNFQLDASVKASINIAMSANEAAEIYQDLLQGDNWDSGGIVDLGPSEFAALPALESSAVNNRQNRHSRVERSAKVAEGENGLECTHTAPDQPRQKLPRIRRNSNAVG